MSYDVAIRCEGCDSAVLDVNMTSNVAPMWRKAGVDLREFHGRPARELDAPLWAAIEDMAKNRHDYEALNPRNGWGDYGSALAFLIQIWAAVVDCPSGTVEVSY